ncbi:MAG: carboxypeptidase-like regulatory domain-containing protein [Ferruginibacter sp.]|nr:carboxypeptidase-like regulatory domain-containing protein [Ferruginibacter sp.]
MKGIKIILTTSFLFTLLGAGFSASAQTIVKGFVKDATTMKPIQFASIYFEGGKGVTTGEDGSYSIVTNRDKLTTLNFSFTGYKKTSRKIIAGKEQTVNIELELSESLKEVVVKTKKRAKYRNKDNPAVELIDLVIENKNKNKIKAYDFVQYQQYEKLSLSLTNKPEKLIKNRLFRNYKFILENIDSTTVEGKSLLPVYLEEKLSDRYLKKNPEKNKTVMLGEKKVNYGDFLDDKGISQYLKRLYADINIYDNNVTILATQFLSPIADMGPSFYRYYIRDTVELEGIKLVKLYFTPRNPNDLLFRGTMFITLDGNYGVQKISMTISKNANLNWTRELRINQDFEKAKDGRFHVIKSSMLAEFALTQNASGGVLGERTVSFKNFLTDIPAPDSIYNGKDLVEKTDLAATPDSFWTVQRHTPLTIVETKAYYNIDSLKNMRSFKRFGEIATLLFSGYKSFGPWELGNTNTFYYYNPVEGFTLKVGGRTTPKFSNFIYFDNYFAYGFNDKKLKYLAAVTYSFNHKSIYSFPLNYLKLSYQYDTDIPGQELLTVNEDNFLLSFKRGNNNKWLYNNYFKVEYVREFGKNLRYNFAFKNWKQTPAGDISYQKVTDNSLVKNVTTSELSAELRWAPNEQFYQGKNFRTPIINKYPIFNLRFIVGVKGLMKGEYNYQNITGSIEKRLYLSQLGYADITLQGGYIWGKLPFPLLTIHRANQTYAYQLNSYNLMNFMEFVSDKYTAANFNFYFNGFFFNKIPLIKKLKLREVASFKILYGGVRDENDPAKTVDLFKFPTDVTIGQQTTFAFNKTPYMEVSVGIANIFKLIRVDLVKRLTYLDNPGITLWGIRTRVRFDF